MAAVDQLIGAAPESRAPCPRDSRAGRSCRSPVASTAAGPQRDTKLHFCCTTWHSRRRSSAGRGRFLCALPPCAYRAPRCSCLPARRDRSDAASSVQNLRAHSLLASLALPAVGAGVLGPDLARHVLEIRAQAVEILLHSVPLGARPAHVVDGGVIGPP